MNTLLLRTSLVAASLMLAACSILPKADPQTVHRLPTATAMPAQASTTAGDIRLRALRIATPYANRSIDSERILVLPEGDVIKSYAGVRWSDAAPLLWRDRLLEAFRADGRYQRLSSDTGNIAADIELDGALTSFQTEYRHGVPTVVIVYDARLIDTANRQQLASQRFAIQRAVDGSKAPEVVSAFGQACDHLAKEVVNWAAAQR